MRIITEPKYDFKDVLIIPKRSTLSSRKEVNLRREFTFRNTNVTYTGTPIIVANMDTVGTMEMANALTPFGVSVALHKHYTVDQLVGFFTNKTKNVEPNPTFYSLGVTDKDLEKFNTVKKTLTDTLGEMVTRQVLQYACIDVANGYSEPFAKFVQKFREENPYTVIMAGNVVTAEMTEQLILSGADIVKVGIGPGSVCTTRKMTGVGYPQLSAIIECADAAHGLGGHICGDGGCTVPGDVAKAFGGGADFVMLGGMMAGHDECAGKLIGVKTLKKSITIEERVAEDPLTMTTCRVCVYTNQDTGEKVTVKYKRSFVGDIEMEGKIPSHFYGNLGDLKMQFYGMSSTTAQEKHNGGVAEYRASEGKTVEVPYKGPVENTIKEILGGVRSACTYVGARRLKDLSKCTTFVLVGQQKNDIFGKE